MIVDHALGRWHSLCHAIRHLRMIGVNLMLRHTRSHHLLLRLYSSVPTHGGRLWSRLHHHRIEGGLDLGHSLLVVRTVCHHCRLRGHDIRWYLLSLLLTTIDPLCQTRVLLQVVHGPLLLRWIGAMKHCNQLLFLHGTDGRWLRNSLYRHLPRKADHGRLLTNIDSHIRSWNLRLWLAKWSYTTSHRLLQAGW